MPHDRRHILRRQPRGFQIRTHLVAQGVQRGQTFTPRPQRRRGAV